MPASCRRSDNVRRDMALGTADGTLYAVMLGLGEAYIVAFGLAAGISEGVAGLLGPIPQMMGASVGLALPWVLTRIGSVRVVTTGMAALQTLALAALAVMALGGFAPAPLLFAVAGLYWLGSVGAGAVWNAWVSSIYPRGIRAKYFGKRSRLAQLGTLAGLVVAGLLLQHAENGRTGGGSLFGTYALLFGAAAACRGASLLLLARLSEPEPIPRGFRDVKSRELVGRFRRDPGGRLLVYMLVLNFGVQISGPFFSPYMLGELELSYAEFMSVLGAAFLTKSIMLPTVGVLAKRLGAGRMLWVGGVAVIPMSGLWVFADSVGALITVNAVSGVAWAFYDIATMLLLFETIPASDRLGMLIRFNLLNFAAAAAGAVIGAGLLELLGAGREAYWVLFIVSGVLRLFALPLIALVHPPRFRVRSITFRHVSIAPGGAAVDRPIVGGLDDEAAAGK